jgi:hypothetical protein
VVVLVSTVALDRFYSTRRLGASANALSYRNNPHSSSVRPNIELGGERGKLYQQQSSSAGTWDFAGLRLPADLQVLGGSALLWGSGTQNSRMRSQSAAACSDRLSGEVLRVGRERQVALRPKTGELQYRIIAPKRSIVACGSLSRLSARLTT